MLKTQCNKKDRVLLGGWATGTRKGAQGQGTPEVTMKGGTEEAVSFACKSAVPVLHLSWVLHLGCVFTSPCTHLKVNATHSLA